MDLHKDAMDAYQQWLSVYRWEWFCTLNLSPKADCAKAEEKLKKWRLNMAITYGILIAYMGVFNTVPQPHIHLLALSKRNKSGWTLLDLDPKDWAHEWSKLNRHRDAGDRFRMVGCTAVIKPIDASKNVEHYLAIKNTPQGRSEFIEPYHYRLIEKAKIG